MDVLLQNEKPVWLVVLTWDHWLIQYVGSLWLEGDEASLSRWIDTKCLGNQECCILFCPVKMFLKCIHYSPPTFNPSYSEAHNRNNEEINWIQEEIAI
jgi:hypothetical protein